MGKNESHILSHIVIKLVNFSVHGMCIPVTIYCLVVHGIAYNTYVINCPIAINTHILTVRSPSCNPPLMESIWEEEQVADQFDIILHTETDMDVVMAKIPSLFGTSLKASYLAFRAMGLNTQQALDMLGEEELTLLFWREGDPDFLTFEKENLWKLQSEIGPELIRLGFLRNMALFIAKDANIIKKSGRLENLSKREFDYLMKVRGHYTPSDMLALEKAVNPEHGQEKVVINLTWGDHHQVIEGVEAEYKLIEGPEDDNGTGDAD